MGMGKVEVLRAACCMAAADNDITDKELAFVMKLAEDAGVGQASLKAMIDRATTEPDFYKEQFNYLISDPEESMKLMFRIAISDHDLDDNEIKMLTHFAKVLGMKPERFRQYMKAADKTIAKRETEGE